MNLSEAQSIIAILTATYRQDMKPDTAEIYLQCIMDLPLDLTRAAVLDLLATSKWLPTIAEIRGAVFDQVDDTPEPGAAWGIVNETIRNSDGEVREWQNPDGTYERSKPTTSGHGLIDEAVKGLGGWRSLRQSENPMADRAHFLKVYAELIESERREAVRLPEARQLQAQARARLEARDGTGESKLWRGPILISDLDSSGRPALVGCGPDKVHDASQIAARN